MNWRLLSAIAAVVSLPTTALSQQVISDDGFASIPWYSTAEEVEAVWGQPLQVATLLEPPLDLVIYRGLPFDHELTFTVFVVHPEQGLVEGNLMVFVADSATAAGKMKQWTATVSSVRGDPVCAFGEGVLSEDQVNMQAEWCGTDNEDCACSDAGVNVLAKARYSDSRGFGLVTLFSMSEFQFEPPLSYFPALAEHLRHLVGF